MRKSLAFLLVAVSALLAGGCSTDNNAAADRAVREMNRHGGPN
jgi:hypothetical protein